ncbi:MAG: amidohydrolase [Fimbriimonadaceae bacterium]|nr:amidohydrolase [Fimbriimonadaceae bacterium]
MRRWLTGFRWGFDGELQSMLIDEGRVLHRGPVGPAPDDASVEDLGGAWVLPAFNDAHCHILPTGLDLQKLYLGGLRTHEEVLDAVRDRLPGVEEGDWLLAVHYDQTRYPGVEHLHRDQLDALSTTVPILLRHSNGHASVANSAALAAAGVDETTSDPPGGSYVRDAAGRLTGVLLERAHEHVSHAKPMPNLEEMVEAILEAARAMRAYGITCAADMMTGQWDLDRELEAFRLASERDCPIRLRLYLQWSTVFGPRAMSRERLQEHVDSMRPERCKVAGIKIFADGAIGSATAGIYGRFLTSTPEGEIDGQMIYKPERLRSMVAKAHEAGYSVSVHSIGDRSTDQVMDAFEAVDEPSRHRLEHAMLLSDAQIERLAEIGCHVAMQPEFLHQLGHAYQRQLGPERASKIKRMRSALDAGIRLSINSDRPIVAGDPWIGVRTAVHRPPGFDPAENLSAVEALNAATAGGADACDDGEEFGQLEPGQWADFQVLATDPTELTPMGEGASPRLLTSERA